MPLLVLPPNPAHSKSNAGSLARLPPDKGLAPVREQHRVLISSANQLVGHTNSNACQISNATEDDLLQPDRVAVPHCCHLCGPTSKHRGI